MTCRECDHRQGRIPAVASRCAHPDRDDGQHLWLIPGAALDAAPWWCPLTADDGTIDPPMG